jgi:hypothetical protein
VSSRQVGDRSKQMIEDVWGSNVSKVCKDMGPIWWSRRGQENRCDTKGTGNWNNVMQEL